MNACKQIAVCLGVVAASAMAFGQNSGPTITSSGTCTTTLSALTSLNLERTITLTNVLSTLTANVPANVLASISGGAQEIRERLVYNPQTATVTSTIFLVASGSPTPTPLAMDIAGQTLQTTTLQVLHIFVGCTPTPSLLLVGTITSAIGGPPLRTGTTSPAAFDLTGAPGALSIGYTTDNPPKVNNIAFVVSGQVVLFSPAATGTVTFNSVAVTPPGTSGSGLKAVITLPGGVDISSTGTSPFQLSQSPLTLSASKSTGTGLTFTWSVSPPVAMTTPTNNTVTLDFPQAGDYTVTLTATDSSGATSKVSVILEFNGRPQ